MRFPIRTVGSAPKFRPECLQRAPPRHTHRVVSRDCSQCGGRGCGQARALFGAASGSVCNSAGVGTHPVSDSARDVGRRLPEKAVRRARWKSLEETRPEYHRSGCRSANSGCSHSISRILGFGASAYLRMAYGGLLLWPQWEPSCRRAARGAQEVTVEAERQGNALAITRASDRACAVAADLAYLDGL